MPSDTRRRNTASGDRYTLNADRMIMNSRRRRCCRRYEHYAGVNTDGLAQSKSPPKHPTITV